MKVLIYSHAFAPQIGGIETFAMYLARGLATLECNGNADPFSVVVVTQTSGPADDTDSKPLPFQIVRRPSVWKMWRLIGKAERVLLAGPAILPLLFALVRRRPLAVTHHGYQSICPNGMLFHLPTQESCPGHFAGGRYLECIKCNFAQQGLAGSLKALVLTFVRRSLTWFADSNVAVSEHVLRRILLPHSLVIRNGVPDKPAAIGSLIPHPHPVCFAYVGRLVAEKGVPVLITAARILKTTGRSFRVLIVGDGPEREALQAQVTSFELDNTVKFLGFQRAEEVAEIMKGVSAMIMPSICEDVAPFSVLEQMMQGRLVIGSLLGGLAEQIGDAGLTFAPGDADELARQMQVVIDRPELVAKIGKSARQRALSAYTLDRMLCDYRKLLGRQGESL